MSEPDVTKGKKKKGGKRGGGVTVHYHLIENLNKPVHPSQAMAEEAAHRASMCEEPDETKSTMGNVPPGYGRSLTEARVSAPLTAGRQASSVDDHGVGQGRSSDLAWAHPDLGQSSPNSFNALVNLQTVAGGGNGDRAITWTAGAAALRMFDARAQAGSFVGMNPVNPSPQRPAGHIAQQNIGGPNGGHSTGNADRPPTQAMKASEAREIMRRHMFPGAGGGR